MMLLHEFHWKQFNAPFSRIAIERFYSFLFLCLVGILIPILRVEISIPQAIGAFLEFKLMTLRTENRSREKGVLRVVGRTFPYQNPYFNSKMNQ